MYKRDLCILKETYAKGIRKHRSLLCGSSLSIERDVHTSLSQLKETSFNWKRRTFQLKEMYACLLQCLSIERDAKWDLQKKTVHMERDLHKETHGAKCGRHAERRRWQQMRPMNTCVPWLIQMCATIHRYVSHDWFQCVPWPMLYLGRRWWRDVRRTKTKVPPTWRKWPRIRIRKETYKYAKRDLQRVQSVRRETKMPPSWRKRPLKRDLRVSIRKETYK